MLSKVPDSWGPKFTGQAGEATLTRTGPSEIEFTASAHMTLVMLTPQPSREVALDSDRKVTFFAPPGSVELVPAGSELFARWSTAKENLLVAVAPNRLARLVQLEFDQADFELEPVGPGVVDERIHALAMMARDEFTDAARPNDVYLDALITVLATEVLRRFTSLRRCRGGYHRGGLTPRMWSRIKDYIYADVSRKLYVDDLAEIAGLSPSQFARAFRETTGQAPHQYILHARLRHAEHLITSTDLPLPAIAQRAGFASHSHLSATMQRLRSTTPTRLRQEK